MSQKTTKGIRIYTGYNFLSMKNKKIEKNELYVAEKDNFTAHGETIKKAISDLQFKIVADKLQNEPINKDTVITVNHYRLITGACQAGVEQWMNSVFSKEERVLILDKGIKAERLLPILKGNHAWGLEKFQSLITF